MRYLNKQSLQYHSKILAEPGSKRDRQEERQKEALQLLTDTFHSDKLLN